MSAKTKQAKPLVAKAVVKGDPAEAAAVAALAAQPGQHAGSIVEEYSKWIAGPQAGAVANVLNAWTGDMKGLEAMLYSQAHALQAMFSNLALTAAAQTSPQLKDTFLRMSLKAQSQCRTTVETLSVIKNPPIVFAKQANINNGGQQQINNGREPLAGACGKCYSEQTKLLEASDGERLDIGTAGSPGAAYPHLEAVEQVHGASYGGRESAGGQERRRLPRRDLAADQASYEDGQRNAPRPAHRPPDAFGDVRRPKFGTITRGCAKEIT